MIDISDIEAAAKRLDGISVRTPLLRDSELDRVAGGVVLIKPECLQVTGSFKIRGAYNLLRQLTPEQAKNGVVAWSSGNHAQGVAAAGALLNIETTIVMPEDAPRAKLENTRKLGGEVVTYDRYSGDREAIARSIALERGAALVPSFDHEHIMAGQGTVGLEIAQDAAALELPPDQVLVPCGGGGLCSGIAVALKDRFPDVSIYPVEPEAFDDTVRSLELNTRVSIDPAARSICDALQTSMPGKLTFEINRRLLQQGLTVSDDEVRDAMRFAFRNMKLVLEPGGAVALAAILSARIATTDKTTVVVLSGGNVDIDAYAEIQAEPN